MADDRETLERIHALVEEEHKLRSSGTPPSHERLVELEVMLDQCWDLLRQRRAKRQYGADPDEAQVRSADVVEHYQQ
jgi:hypothetical protein